ncbi:MAG: signal peptide peptidase SppA [Myxococcota bacterium]
MRRAIAFWIALGVVALIGWSLWEAGPRIPDRGVLAIDLAGTLADPPAMDTVARWTSRGPALPTLILQLEKAAQDDRIVGVLLRVRGIQAGFAQIQELRDSLERVRQAGTRVVVLLDLAAFNATRELYLASAADRVFAMPGLLAPLAGIAGEFLHLGAGFEKLGIRIEYERIGKYKSAPEMFSGEEMSAPAREVATDLLDRIYRQLVDGIAAGRGLEAARVRELIEAAPASSRELIEAGLIDGEATPETVIEAAGLEDAERVDYAQYLRVDPRDLRLRNGPAVGLIFASGTITQSAGRFAAAAFTQDRVVQALQDAASDDDVRAIVLRIDSGGGSAQASDAIWQAVRAARERKPVVVSMGNAAASGGYYVASGADAIVAEPATLTGSIGVFFIRPAVRELYHKLGISAEVLTRGSFAAIGSMSLPMTEGVRARARVLVRSMYDAFLNRVSTGRGLDRERVDALGQGRVWLGESARADGLIDEIGGLHAAVARAQREAGIAPEIDPARVIFPGPRSLQAQLRSLLRGSMRALVLQALGLDPLPADLERSWEMLSGPLDGPVVYLPEAWLVLH